VSDRIAELKIEDINPVKKKLTIEVPWDDVKQELDEEYKLVGRKAKIRGFRPGKVPRNILVSHYRDQVENETITKLITRHYSEAVQKNNILAVDQPQIEQDGIEENKDFSFTATVETQPEIDPQGYKGIETEKERFDVTGDDVDKRIQQIREMYAQLEEVKEERGIRKDDFTLIDFEISVDGEVIDEFTSKDYMLQVGSGRLIPNFEDKLVDMKKGETKEDTVTFPEDFDSKNVAGKEGTFTVTVKDIREKILPALDEDFIKNFEKYETIDDLKDDVTKSLEEEEKMRVEGDLRKRLIDKLLESNEFEIPNAWVEQQIYYMMVDAQRRMVGNGMNQEKATEISMNLHETFKDEAVRIVKTSVLIGKISEKESITVDESDIEDKIKSMGERYGRDYESMKKLYDNEDMQNRLRDELMDEKTFKFIEEHAIITEVDKKPDTEEKN